MIPLLQPSVTPDEHNALSEVLESRWWGNGPKCAEFEERIAEMSGYKYAVTVNSATAALHLALRVNNIGLGDEVIVPALTFASTALAVTYTGARPVFADVNTEHLCIDAINARRLQNTATRAIISVDYGGYPTPGMDEFSLPVIQDAAHNIGGYLYGDEVCFSFHPVKNLATGDGGCILTNNKEHYERMKRLRWCGIDRSTYDRIGKGYNWEYDINEIGYKCHWNDIQAAIGLEQLRRLEYINGWRRNLAEKYTELLSEIDGVEVPKHHPMHTWHLYVIRVDAEIRDALIDHLRSKGISAGVHYKPLTQFDIYRQSTPPITRQEWRRLITLPLYFDLSEEDIERICKTIIEGIDKCQL